MAQGHAMQGIMEMYPELYKAVLIHVPTSNSTYSVGRRDYSGSPRFQVSQFLRLHRIVPVVPYGFTCSFKLQCANVF